MATIRQTHTRTVSIDDAYHPPAGWWDWLLYPLACFLSWLLRVTDLPEDEKARRLGSPPALVGSSNVAMVEDGRRWLSRRQYIEALGYAQAVNNDGKK